MMAKYLDFKLRFGETAMPLGCLWHFAGGCPFSTVIGQPNSETSILSSGECSHPPLESCDGIQRAVEPTQMY